jgi:hypothetical protein
MKKRRTLKIIISLAAFYAAGTVSAQDGASVEAASSFSAIDTMWVLLAAFLVFFMQAGFGMVEAGFVRAKNSANVLMKNVLDFCMAALGYFMFGYAIMFGGGNGLIGTSGWFLIGAESGADGIPVEAFWLFQARDPLWCIQSAGCQPSWERGCSGHGSAASAKTGRLATLAVTACRSQPSASSSCGSVGTVSTPARPSGSASPESSPEWRSTPPWLQPWGPSSP